LSLIVIASVKLSQVSNHEPETLAIFKIRVSAYGVGFGSAVWNIKRFTLHFSKIINVRYSFLSMLAHHLISAVFFL
jgi:hypothetical protein